MREILASKEGRRSAESSKYTLTSSLVFRLRFTLFFIATPIEGRASTYRRVAIAASLELDLPPVVSQLSKLCPRGMSTSLCP